MAQGFGRFMAQASDGNDSGSQHGGGGPGTSEEARMVGSIIGRIIGANYRVLKLIGTGAMGHVYQAEQMSLGKMVALKLLRSELQADERLLKRFELEARNASRLNHPNSIQIIDFGRDQDLLYIAMELLQGVDLGQLILREGPLPLGRIGRIMDQVLGALDEAHAQGIVHRDLKPSNIMLASRRGDPDFVKVCDFGIAKAQTSREGAGLTMKGLVCGTPEYMSPEQARGDDVDGRSDLYAVGVILYQLVTGDLPFTASSPVGILSKHLTDPPEPPSLRKPGLAIPAGLERIILTSLAKEPADRPATAEQLRRHLRAVLADLPDRSLHTGPGDWSVIGREGLPGQPTTPVTIPQATARSARTESASLPSLVLTPSTLLTRRTGPLLWLALALLGAGACAWLVLRPVGLPHPGGPEQPAAVAATRATSLAPLTASPVVPAPPASPPGAETVSPGPAIAPSPSEPGRPRRPARRTPHGPAVSTPPAPTAAFPPPVEEATPDLPVFPVPPRNLLHDAEQLLAQGQVASACGKGEDEKGLNPSFALVYRFLGKCYMRAGQPERARENFRRYLELAPDASDSAFIKSIVK